MSVVLYMVVGLLLVIIQTTIIHEIPLLHGTHDLLLLLVVYGGLYRPLRESLPLALAMGLIMDGLSGGPPGLYVTAYLWICIGITWLITFLHVRNRLLLPVVFAAAVVLENIVLLGGMVLLVSDVGLPESTLSGIIISVIWVVFTGPAFCLSANAVHQKIGVWYGARLPDKRDGYERVTSA